MAASDKQKEMFGYFQTNESPDSMNWIREEQSSRMRDWYRKGQRTFRQCLAMGAATQVENLNDMLNELKSHEKEGFLMGWQSDAWAHDNNKPFSVEGATHAELPQT